MRNDFGFNPTDLRLFSSFPKCTLVVKSMFVVLDPRKSSG